MLKLLYVRLLIIFYLFYCKEKLLNCDYLLPPFNSEFSTPINKRAASQIPLCSKRKDSTLLAKFEAPELSPVTSLILKSTRNDDTGKITTKVAGSPLRAKSNGFGSTTKEVSNISLPVNNSFEDTTGNLESNFEASNISLPANYSFEDTTGNLESDFEASPVIGNYICITFSSHILLFTMFFIQIKN